MSTRPARSALSRARSLLLLGIFALLALSLALPGSAVADNVFPITSISGIPNSWVNHDLVFTLSTDNPAITDETYYWVGWYTNGTYTGPVTVPYEGVTLIEFQSSSFSCITREDIGGVFAMIDKSPPVSTIHDIPTGTVSPGPQTFSITASDTYSGVSGTYYRVDGGPIRTSNGSAISVVTSVPVSIEYWSVDMVGNAEAPRTAVIEVDDGNPFTWVTGLPVGWTSQDATLTLSARSLQHTIAGTFYQIDSGAIAPYSGPFEVSAEGTTIVSYYSTDNIGGIESTRTGLVLIDKTPPVSDISPTPDWSETDVGFSLSATDALSGVSSVFYELDGGGPIPYSGPVTMSKNGTSTVNWWAVDAAGNAEPAHETTIQVDKGPETTATGIPADWTSTDVTISLSAFSPRHAITGTHYRIGSGQEETYTVPIVLSAEGTVSVEYWSLDDTGAREPTRTAHIGIDRGLPSSSISGVPAGWSAAPVTFSLTATDPLSGPHCICYQINEETPTPYPGTPLTVSTEGTTKVTWWAFDVAGNVESSRTALVRIDKGRPETTVSGIPVGWTSSDVVFNLSGSDAVSGIGSTFYRLGLNPSGDSVYGGPVTVSAEGLTPVLYWSIDKAGNVESGKMGLISIDKTPPTTTIGGLPDVSVPPGTYSFTLSRSDSRTGVAATYYRVQGGATRPYAGGAVAVTATSTTSIEFWSVDGVGNTEPVQTSTIIVDTGVPSTSISGVPGSWSRSDVTFTLSPSSLYSVVTGTWFRVGSDDPLPYTAPVQIGAEGITNVTWASRDENGGVEPTRSAQIRIDKTSPVTTVSGIPTTSPVAGPVVFDLQASDAVSGLSSIWYRLNGGNQLLASGPITVSAAGQTTVAYWAVDQAGNIEPERTATFTIGRAASSVTIKASATTTYIGKTDVLSGAVAPDGMVGQIVVVYVQKPGSARWSYSSNRGVYSLNGKPAWQYKYYFKRGMTRGYYKFKTVVPQTASFLSSTSKTLSVRLR